MSVRILRLRVAGRVQGVGYRDFVRGEADARNLLGWVRNRRDGTVEVVVSGACGQVEELIAACWGGPPASRVADVRIEAIDAAEGELPAAGFAIRPTI